MDTELDRAQRRIEELEDILRDIVGMFENYDGRRKLAHGITMAPVLRAKEALGLLPKRRDHRQTELPL